MKLKHIKANGKYYRPQKAGVKNPVMRFSNYHVCKIKKLPFGRWRIDYFDEAVQFYNKGGYTWGDEDTPNQRVILYPSGIDEIRYEL